MNIYYKILNEIASVFDIDQWDEQVNIFTNVISRQLRPFVHNTKNSYIFILEQWGDHGFPQYYFYAERCYVNGEKVVLDDDGTTENKWWDQETVNVTIEDLDQLSESCEYMFFACSSLVSVPKFDTSGVTNMVGMFARCTSLESVPKFDTSNVTNMNDMFYDCPSLSEETKQEWSSVYNF